MTAAKNTICIWYDKGARQAAEFYATVFPDSKVRAVHTAPADYPSGRKGDETRRAFEAMMTMRKIDVATIDAARGGDV